MINFNGHKFFFGIVKRQAVFATDRPAKVLTR